MNYRTRIIATGIIAATLARIRLTSDPHLTSPCPAVRFLGRLLLVVAVALCHVVRNARLCRWAKTGKRVEIPRCRATVSEETALGHWEKSREGRGRDRMGKPSLLAKPGDRRAPSYFNLFRVQRRQVCAYSWRFSWSGSLFFPGCCGGRSQSESAGSAICGRGRGAGVAASAGRTAKFWPRRTHRRREPPCFAPRAKDAIRFRFWRRDSQRKRSRLFPRRKSL